MVVHKTTYCKYLETLKSFNYLCDQLDRMATQENVKEETLDRQTKILEGYIKTLSDLEAELIEIGSIDYKRSVIDGRIMK